MDTKDLKFSKEHPHFSLIIPAWNEEKYLPRLLDTIEIARQNYRGGYEAIELILADNMSTDDTAAVGKERNLQVIRVEKRTIAAARNGGAAIARGSVLCFVDADFRIHPETFNVIADTMNSSKYIAGATGVKMERLSLGLIMTLAMMLPMVWLTKMDTGVVFCWREAFQSIEGYNEGRLFAEDVQFLFELRRLGKQYKRGLARATKAKAIASARKFDKHGDWHYFGFLFFFILSFLTKKISLDAKAQTYWYEDER